MNNYLASFCLVLLVLGGLNSTTQKNPGNPEKIIRNPSQQLTPPSFPGGKDSLFEYIFGHLEWPKTNDKVDGGVVTISFFVEKDGTLTGFVVEQSYSPSLDAKVIYLLKKSPKWIPAKRDGVPIRSHYKLPIRYHAETEDLRSKDSVK